MIAIKANPGRAFPVKVVTLTKPELIVFRGGMPLGLFTGERTYTLRPEGNSTRFTSRSLSEQRVGEKREPVAVAQSDTSFGLAAAA